MGQRTTTLVAGSLAVTVGAVGVAARLARRRAEQLDHLETELRRQLARRARHTAGRLEGLAYRVGGAVPDPQVSDDVLEQRVRSAIGPLEKRLDLPRIHVTVVDHVASLHGAVDTATHAQRLVRAVRAVSGVRDVRDHLHIGLGRGDARPSEGRAHQPPSALRRDLLGAARETGLRDEERVERVTRATLAGFLELLPRSSRRQLLTHLPEDVRDLADAPCVVGTPATPRTTAEFDRLVAECAGDLVGEVAPAIRDVLTTLRSAVPEEADDVAAVLPEGLAALWRAPTPAA